MRVFSIHDFRRTATPVPFAMPPMSAAQYLRLRRTAAGLSIDDVAARLAPRIADRAEAAGLVRSLETPERYARARSTVDRFAAIIPLDPDVYFQLVEEPADRHPTICRGCGCSEGCPCTGDRGICSLALSTLCTSCADRSPEWAGFDSATGVA